MLTIYHYGGHNSTKTTSQTFQSNILHHHDRTAAGAGDTRARHSTTTNLFVVLSSLCCTTFSCWNFCLHTENNACLVCVRFHREHNAFVLLLAEPASLEEGNISSAVLASDCPCPEIGDGRFSFYGLVEACEISFGLLQDPPTPGTDMPCKVSFN